MGKKILVISASPRRGGNSDTLCDEFIRGARERGNEAEKIFVRDKNIRYCTGCGVCLDTHWCVQKDDMAEILDKMAAADAIVLATPVYFYTMDAQLKTVIDRCLPRYEEIRGKDVYFIVTAADDSLPAMERVISALRGFTADCLPDAREKGIVYGVGLNKAGEVQGSPALKEAYELGLNA